MRRGRFGVPSIQIRSDWNATTGGAVIDNKPTAFAPSAHAHPILDVTGLTTALLNKLETSLKGSVNGLAELDSNGFVLNTQLPSYVDDVLEFTNFAAFPLIGESGKIYITQDTNITYRWSGTAYAEISASLALGETSATAYRGDRGKTAYDYSQIGHVTLADGRIANWTEAYTWGNHAAAGYGLASALTTHAGLTTTAHGLGASAFHDDNYFAPASGSTNYVQISPSSAQSGYASITGAYRSSNAGESFRVSEPTSANPYSVALANAGAGAYFGIEGGTSGGYFTGSQAYETVIYTSTPLYITTNTRINGTIKSKGTIVNTATTTSESNIVEIRSFNDANLIGSISYNQDDDHMRVVNKSSYGGSKLSFATNNVDRYSIDVTGNHDFKTGTAKFGNLAGSTTRLSAVTSDGTIASITNGTEGQVMKIVGGVPAFGNKPSYTYSEITGTPTIPTLTSQLTNNSGFVTSDTNNYPTSLSYSGTTLTLGRNGLSNLTATISGAGMVYPSGSGIPIVSGGTSWGTTITNNSTNWNTAYTNMGKVRLNGGSAFNLLDAVYFNESGGVTGINTSSLVGQDPYLPITSLAVQQALSSYQSTLVSGTNIKTVNGASLLGSGNIALADVNGNYANYFRLDRLYFGSATAWNMWGGGTTLEFNYNGVTKATLTSSGVFTAQEVYRGSSRTLKHDIEPLITSALEMINQTIICSYKMNADNSFAVGFIAEDTHPWLSGTDQKRHNFGNHLGLLTKAIQEEEVKIVALERKMKDLENELNQLKHGRG